MTDRDESPPRLEILRHRRQFLDAARGRKCVMPAFVLQAARRPGADAVPTVGIGYTASRKIGKAVARNRAKRRLREAARALLPDLARPGWNYVLVARQAVLTCPFAELKSQLATALERVHRPAGAQRRAPRRAS